MSTRFDRFTEKAQEALIAAQTLGRDGQHAQIDTEHLLLALLDDEEAAGGGALTGLGLTRERARDWLVSALEQIGAAKRQNG